MKYHEALVLLFPLEAQVQVHKGNLLLNFQSEPLLMTGSPYDRRTGRSGAGSGMPGANGINILLCCAGSQGPSWSWPSLRVLFPPA